MADTDFASAYIPALHKPAALLPIARHRDSLLYCIETYPVTIVVGQTGSGKTTQIPQFLEQAGWCADGKLIAVTQPRRVAAVTVASRVAEEVGCKLGEKVGYSIRFEDVTSSATRIKFVTDGLLLREALVDPLLSRYAVVMVDEAHERSLSTDILLGVLKKIRRKRPELRIIVSSATLQAEEFVRFFAGATAPESDARSSSTASVSAPAPAPAPAQTPSPPETSICRIVTVEGRMYPVDILYLEQPAADYVEAAVNTCLEIHTKEPDGDILLFLTGREEIERAISLLSERSAYLHPDSPALLPLPLYAGLPTDQQLHVFEPAPAHTRKAIVATNIAEASVTVDGIVYVVDCGFVKLRAYDPRSNIDRLTVTPASLASAAQRAGRAGRTRPGKCFRLYPEAAVASAATAAASQQQQQRRLPRTTAPEIQRANLAPVVLQLKALGIDNVARFDFLTPPPAELVARALELLFALGALDDHAKLTRPLGLRMAELALEPMLARALLAAARFGCLGEMLSVAAMTSLQGGSVWFYHPQQQKQHHQHHQRDGDRDYDDAEGGSGSERKALDSARRKFAAAEGDHLTLLNVYQGFVGRGRREARWCREHHLDFRALSRAVSIRAQLKRHLERFGISDAGGSGSGGGGGGGGGSGGVGSGGDALAAAAADKGEAIRKCLTAGFFAHAARMQPDGTFRTADRSPLTLHAHPSSVMFNRKVDWVIFHEVVQTSSSSSSSSSSPLSAADGDKGQKIFIKDISTIQRDWLLECAPDYYQLRR